MMMRMRMRMRMIRKTRKTEEREKWKEETPKEDKIREWLQHRTETVWLMLAGSSRGGEIREY